MQITVDADHLGGNIKGDNLEQIANGQRWHVRIFPPAGESLLPNQTCFFYSQLEFIDSEELLWGVEPEVFRGCVDRPASGRRKPDGRPGHVHL